MENVVSLLQEGGATAMDADPAAALRNAFVKTDALLHAEHAMEAGALPGGEQICACLCLRRPLGPWFVCSDS